MVLEQEPTFPWNEFFSESVIRATKFKSVLPHSKVRCFYNFNCKPTFTSSTKDVVSSLCFPGPGFPAFESPSYLADLILSASAFFHKDSKLLAEDFRVDGTGCREPIRTNFSNIDTSRIIIMYYHALMFAQVTRYV